MRILFVSPFFVPESVGGVEWHVYHLARRLGDRGHQAWVFAWTGTPGPEYEVREDRTDAIPVVRVRYHFSDCERFEGLYRNSRIDRIFEEWLDRLRPEVVHAHHLTCLSTGIVERCRTRGVPVVLTLHDFWMGCLRGQRIRDDLDRCREISFERCGPCLHGFWPHLFPAGETGRELFERYHEHTRRILGLCDRIVTPSAFHREEFVRYGVEADRIVAVENGIPGDLAEVRRADPKRVRFAYVGTVMPSKGVHVLAEAWRGLRPDGRSRLDVWGEVRDTVPGGEYGRELSELLSGREDASLHGRFGDRDLPRIYRDVDCLVVPSLWYESFCLTLREAFLAGSTAIVSDHGPLRDAVVPGVTGLVFPPGDVEGLRAHLAELRDDRGMLERLCGAPKPVRSVDEAASELVGIYRACALR